MAELDLTNIFNDCVDRIAQGQSIDECLRRYPQYTSTLRPMLEAGLLVQRMRIQPTEVLAAQARVRQRFEDALRAPPPGRVGIARQFVYAIAAVFIIGFIAIGSLNLISQNSLPGDTLYSLKMFSEGLQRSLADSEALEASFDQRRIQEIQQLLALGRTEDVTFSGVITSQTGINWVIASLPITVSLDVPNAAAVHVGDQVEVTARTTELGTLVALTIQASEPVTAPLPTPLIHTLIPTVIIPPRTTTSTPQPSATKPVPSPTPQPTQSPVPTLSAIPQITILTPTVCVATRPNGWIAYQIRSGDSLSALATGQSISLAELMAVNCMSDASRIVAGNTIYLPRTPAVAPTATNSNNQGSGNTNPTDDHGGNDSGDDDNSGHGGDGNSGSGGGSSDDSSGHT